MELATEMEAVFTSKDLEKNAYIPIRRIGKNESPNIREIVIGVLNSGGVT